MKPLIRKSLRLSVYILIIPLLLFFFPSCQSDSSGNSAGNGNTGTDPNLSGTLSGRVSSEIQPSGVSGSLAAASSHSNVMMAASLFQAMESPVFTVGTCQNSAYEVRAIGGGNSLFSSGFTGAAGEFLYIDVPDSDEAVVSFSCGLYTAAVQRCFGRGGMQDLLCDPLAHAIVTAMEYALGEVDITDPMFKGIQVSVIAQGLAESLKMTWTPPFGDPNNDLTQPIRDAIIRNDVNTPKDLYDILFGSAVGSFLDNLKTYADEVRFQNQGQDSQTAAENTWTIGKVINYLVGLGMDVMINADDSAQAPGIYSPVMDEIDAMTQTTYHQDLRTYLYDQYNKNPGYAETIDLVCVARNKFNWQAKELIYPPVLNAMTADTNDISCNPDNSNTTVGDNAMATEVFKGRCLDTLITVEGSCTSGVYWDKDRNACYFSSPTTEDACRVVTGGQWQPDYEVYLSLRPDYMEANRNDPTGKFIRETELTNLRIHSLEMFKEAISAFGFDGTAYADSPVGFKCQGYLVSPDQSASHIWEVGPYNPTDCNKTLVGKYFSGVIGTYKFFRNTKIRDFKFSLNDLYDTFVNTKYMSVRFGADLESIDKGQEVRLLVKEQKLDSIILPQYSLVDQLNGTVKVQCLYNDASICSNTNAIYLNPVNPWSVLLPKILPVYEKSVPSFSSLFGLYLKLPALYDIQKSVFNDMHHVSWNITGAAYYNIKGVDTSTAPDNVADVPLLCYLKSKIIGEYTKGTPVICGPATVGVWTNGVPDKLAYTTYKSYYALQERSTGSDGIDTFYALVSIMTGQDLKYNGNEFRIRGVKSDGDLTYYNAALDSKNDLSIRTNGLDTTIMYNFAAKFCKQYIDSRGNIQYECWEEIFNYITVPLKTSFFPTASEYIPYYWNVLLGKGTMSIAVSNNDTTDVGKDDFGVCVLLDSGLGKTTGVQIGASFYEINAVVLGPDSVVSCTNPPYRYYYLRLLKGQSPLIRGNYKYQLVYSDGGLTKPVKQGSCSNLAYTTFSTCVAAKEVWSDATLVSLGDLESFSPIAAGKIVLGPASDYAGMPSYDIVNFSHDSTYDPYCAVSSVTQCDTNGDKKYDLLDKPLAGYTISEPVMRYDPLDPVNKAEYTNYRIALKCSLLKGLELASCLNTNGIADISVITTAKFNYWFACASGNSMTYVDPAYVADQTNYSLAGGNCGKAGAVGPVYMRLIIQRNNAFDIEKPNAVMKLLSAGTSVIGTGTQVDPAQPLFQFTEALPLVLSRAFMPVKLKVYDLTYQPDIWVSFTKYDDLDNLRDSAASGVLRAFLEKSGALK